MHLDDKKFLEIIDLSPLVSIDLIVYNDKNKVLLGKRANRPAKDYWFVPGGRIRKNEKIEDAIKRISRSELGIELSSDQGKLLGVFNHIYPDDYFNIEGVNTHYVVLAYQFKINTSEILKDTQHSEMRWWEVDKIVSDPNVHEHTKDYFR